MVNQRLVIGLTGDVMMGRGVDDVLTRNGYIFSWGNVLSAFESTDLNIINLETALTNSNHKSPKTFNFKASPDKIKSLTQACITIVNLANNHILDFSEEGLMETIQSLTEGGIKFVGAGKNDKEASKPVVLTKNNIKIGVLGFTDNEPGWKAGISKSGVNYINISKKSDRDKALADIENLSKEADIVVISIHWGSNMKEYPESHFISFAHEMIEYGADIIHGHSAHNFQGIEVYNQKIIFYNAGDFLDDYIVDPVLKNDHSFFYRIEVDKEGIIKTELIPVLISSCQVNLATGQDYNWCLERMQYLSNKFGTNINDKGEILLRTKSYKQVNNLENTITNKN